MERTTVASVSCLGNHWRSLRSWDPRAQEAVDWACAQFPEEIQRRGIARCYYEFLWEADELLKVLPNGVQGMRVLDVGCGAGVLSLVMARLGANVTVIDRFDEYEPDQDNHMGDSGDIISRFQTHGIRVLRGDVTTQGLPEDGGFDLITCFAVIEHLPESPAGLLAAMRRQLKPGGHVVITTPNHAWLRTRLRLLSGRSVHFPIEQWWTPPFFGHIREYTMPELRAMLEWSGFTVSRASLGNWVHLSSRLNTNSDGSENWTTRFTLNSIGRWIVAVSLLVSAFFPSLQYSMLVIGRKSE